MHDTSLIVVFDRQNLLLSTSQ